MSADDLILVTGGSGFLGTNCIKLLLEKGHRVRTTVRDSKNEAKVVHLKDLVPGAKHPVVDIVDANLLDSECWGKAVEGCSYVMHTASPFPISNPKTADEVIKPAVEGTMNVLKACAAAGTVKRVVLTSSAASIFGDQAKTGTLYNEDNWLDLEDKTLSHYTRSKGLAEKSAWDFVNELPDGQKFELAVINPGLILGPVRHGSIGGSVNVMKILMDRQYAVVPKIHMHCCDVRDVTLAHYICMTKPEAAGKRHLIMTESKLFTEMADVLDKEFRPQGYNIPTRGMPNWVLSGLGVFSAEMKNAKKFGHMMEFDNSRMKTVLGIDPIPVPKSCIDMAYSLIEKGMVERKTGYKGQGGDSSAGGAAAASS